jgi:ribosomal protein S18 acetylase RimI-like enzyme
MLATPAVSYTGSRDGPRPTDLGKDIKQVLNLLDLSFGPLVDSQGRRLISDRVSLSYSSPFIQRLGLAGGAPIPGFVWEEDGRIIGNVSLLESKLPGRYLVANVVVHPDHRRRGLATSLMQETINYIIHRRGDTVMLQVEEQNEPALRMYESLNFYKLGSMRHWESKTSQIRILHLPNRNAPQIRELRGHEWRAAFHLDKASLEPDLNWPLPPRLEKYKSGPMRWFTNIFSGLKMETWVVTSRNVSDSKLRLSGLASIITDWGMPHKLEMRVDPALRGTVERPLFAKLLRRLKHLRNATLRLSHSADDDYSSSLFKEANFTPRRNLMVMKLDLNQKKFRGK